MILFGFEKWGFWVWLNVLWLNICLRWACECVCVCCGYSFGLDFWVSNEWWFLGFKWTVVGWVFTLYRLGLMSKWVLIWVILCVSYWVSEICYCLASLLLLLLWPLSPLLLLLKVFVEMLHRVLAYLFVFCLIFSFLFGFLC